MPHQELTHRFQKALLWRATGVDPYGRYIREATSTELVVRWENVISSMVNVTGNLVQTISTVHVDREIEIGSIMWEGSLEDLANELPGTGTGNDLIPTSNLMEVVAYNECPDIRNRAIRRTVGLQFLKDTMPPSS